MKQEISDYCTTLLSTPPSSSQSLEPKEDWLFFFFNCSSVLPPAAMALLPPCGRRAVLSLLEMSQSTSPSGWVVQMLKAAMKGFREHFPINACLALQTIVQNLFCILEAVSSLSSLNSLHHKSLSVPGLMDGWMHLEHEDEDLTF